MLAKILRDLVAYEIGPLCKINDLRQYISFGYSQILINIVKSVLKVCQLIMQKLSFISVLPTHCVISNECYILSVSLGIKMLIYPKHIPRENKLITRSTLHFTLALDLIKDISSLNLL